MGLKLKYRILLVSCITLVLTNSCGHDFPEVPENNVGALEGVSLSKPIFIGSSWLSGVANGAITTENGAYSLPDIFLNHLNEPATLTAYSPTVNAENGFNIYENSGLNNTQGQYELYFPSFDTMAFDRRIVEGMPFAYDNAGGTISNYSFPKAQILDFTESSRNENDFIPSFLTGSTGPLADQIANESPSFFLLDMGNEDLLGYATNGGIGESGQADINSHQYEDLLDANVFEQKLQSMVDDLLASGADVKGALFNIPDFLKFPFFLKVKWDVTPFICPEVGSSNGGTFCFPNDILTDTRNQAAAYNQMLNQYYTNNPSIPFEDRRKTIHFDNDNAFSWGILVEDERLSEVVLNGTAIPKVRHMENDELAFFSNESFLDATRGIFPSNALSESQYLRADEVLDISSMISAYNQAIENVVASSNGRVSLIDINGFFEGLFTGLSLTLNQPAEGILIDGVPFLPIVGEFGIFSADGLNLNPRGNALIADQIIQSLNIAFNGSLKGINPNNFLGTPIKLPD